MRKKIAVITGGASGLGLAAARCLSTDYTLLLCSRKTAALEKAKAEFETFGTDVYTCTLDVTDPESVQKCADYAASLGDITAVVHAAGVSSANTGAEAILKINALGPVNIVNTFYPQMAENGVMICFSSQAGYNFSTLPDIAPLYPLCKETYKSWNEPDFYDRLLGILTNVMQIPMEATEAIAGMAYVLSKSFVRWFISANTCRFARKSCRIISVSPGAYMTPMHQALLDNDPETAQGVLESIPMGRWGHPYEMGALIKFLCSNGAGFITGVDILADGGCTFTSMVEQID